MEKLTAAMPALLLLALSGCWQANICSNNEECAGYECGLECPHRSICSAGACKCECIEPGGECSTDNDCQKTLECGMQPNKAICANGYCKCRYECERAEDCQDFGCLIDCRPNYPYCESNACTCACETSQQELEAWQLGELDREGLVGKVIIVKGTARPGTAACTEIACENGCCNTCTADLELFSESGGKSGFIALGGTYKGREVQCSGTECELSCYPLEIEDTYKVSGLWEKQGGRYYLEPSSFSVLEKGKPRISSGTGEYGREGKPGFVMEYGKGIFFHSTEKPRILKKQGSEWEEYELECGCIVQCETESARCEDNLLECREENTCSEVSAGVVWAWDGKYCQQKEIDCDWENPGIGDKLYCGEMVGPVPGTYKVEFTYSEECPAGAGAKSTVYSNEFRVI